MTFDGSQTDQSSSPSQLLRQAFQQHQQQQSNNQKSTMRRTKQRAGIHRSLADCCYSVSNLALIVACILALIFAAKFLNDDSLYDYGEHLLTWRFYRQIVYIVVLLPLVLLVPLFNAISSIFLTERLRLEFGKTLLSVKLIYQILLAVLVLIGLIFIVPSIRFTSVAGHVGYELRRHMKRRYENDFSFEFLDRIQEEYKCCDHAWYAANFVGKIPLSCYQPDNFYTIIYEQDCANVIGTIVSDRCSAIAAGLFAILIALAVLIAMDAIELLSLSARKYDVGAREQTRDDQADLEFVTEEPNLRSTQAKMPTTQLAGGGGGSARRNGPGDSDHDDDYLVDQINDRLKLNEREHETPLLAKQPAPTRDVGQSSMIQPGSRQPVQLAIDRPIEVALEEPDSHQYPPVDPYNSRLATRGGAAPVLTRANYDLEMPDDRPQSPLFVSHVKLADSSTSLGQAGGSEARGASSGHGSLTPTKSALKKVSSFQRIDDKTRDEEFGYADDDDDDEGRGDLIRYQRQIHRELQTRRSLLNVRFAE